jgi:hypothetical protein
MLGRLLIASTQPHPPHGARDAVDVDDHVAEMHGVAPRAGHQPAGLDQAASDAGGDDDAQQIVHALPGAAPVLPHRGATAVPGESDRDPDSSASRCRSGKRRQAGMMTGLTGTVGQMDRAGRAHADTDHSRRASRRTHFRDEFGHRSPDRLGVRGTDRRPYPALGDGLVGSDQGGGDLGSADVDGEGEIGPGTPTARTTLSQ